MLMEDFYIEKKIYYHDTDCGGVVYYANYLKYLEEARTEFLLSRGIELPKLAERDVVFVVARVEIDYKSPARYQEKIRISAAVEEAKMSAIKFYQEIRKGSTLLARARTTLVCVGSDFKAQKLPEDVKLAISKVS
jgi:acyl-CoA thioester hydrolase